MERPDSTNYPVLRLIKGVLLNTFVKKLDTFLYILPIYLSLLAASINVQCFIFRPWLFTYVFNNIPVMSLSTG